MLYTFLLFWNASRNDKEDVDEYNDNINADDDGPGHQGKRARMLKVLVRSFWLLSHFQSMSKMTYNILLVSIIY